MLGGNCEKMVLFTPSSITNQWPQQSTIHDEIIDDHNKASSMTSTNNRTQHQQQQQQQQQQQTALKCPRCDSSNTKFCYYNNYSLSQPRHFCKACKRYWTRGGTLRNVPVGGGCRKNKRVKRPTENSSNSNSNSSSGTASNPCSPQIDITASSTTSNHAISPLLFGLLPNNNNPWFNSRVVSSSSNSGYDLLQSQLNSLGLGFSSGGMIMSSGENGFTTSNNNTFLSSNNYNSIFGTSTSSFSSNSCASLMPSLVMPQKYMNNGGVKDGGNNFQGFERENRLEEEWNNGGVCQNQILNQQQHVVGLSDDPSSLYYWSTTTTGGAAWKDHHQPPNITGPSVTSLI